MKKKKLNSTNPKYYPVSEINLIKKRRELIASNKIMKAYAVFEID